MTDVFRRQRVHFSPQFNSQCSSFRQKLVARVFEHLVLSAAVRRDGAVSSPPEARDVTF